MGTCTPPASKHLTFDVCMGVIATVSSSVSFDGVSVEPLPALVLVLCVLYSWVFSLPWGSGLRCQLALWKMAHGCHRFKCFCV